MTWRSIASTHRHAAVVVAAGAEGGHVEDVADRPAASVDAAGSFELAAVVVVRGETDEGGDLLPAHVAELRQPGDEAEGEHRADAGHGGQALVAASEIRLGGDHLGEALVEEQEVGLEPHQAALG